MNGGHLVRNRRSHHGSERGHAEGVQHGSNDERSRVSGKAQAEVSEQRDEHQQTFRHCHGHKRYDLSEQEFMRRNAGNINLENGLLLAFLRHGQRSQ